MARILREHDPAIIRIVERWPRNFDPKRALSLDFKADESFEAIIRTHIEDDAW